MFESSINKNVISLVKYFHVLFMMLHSRLEQNASSKLEEISTASRAGIEYSIMHNKVYICLVFKRYVG